MRQALHSIAVLIGRSLVALVATAFVSGIWTGLLLANLATAPALPWSAAVMLALLGLLWWAFGSRRGGNTSGLSVRDSLRAGPIPLRVMAWAVLAGLLWLVSLAALWIVLHQLVPTPAARRPDYSSLNIAMVLATLATASISGAISEEAAFRGYLQGSLEGRGLGASAIMVTAVVMAPEHALTQGFVWPTLLFYLLVDGMLGILAFVTKSIRPGIVVHVIGLFIFLAFVWPHDADRRRVWSAGADLPFWFNVALIPTFGVAGLAVLAHLRQLVGRATSNGGESA